MSRYRTVTSQTELPVNWKWVPLGEILSNIIGGGTPSKNNPSYWQGNIPWLTIKDMRTRRPMDSIDHISEDAVKESATNIIPADTVIIATRVGLGKVIRVPYDATINQDLKALIPKDGIDKSYLEYWIVSIADYLELIGSGTTVKGVRLETLREIPFPLAPPENQKRIVAEIEKQFSRLDEAVTALKRIQSNLKRYKAAVLKAAVEGKLTEQWRKEHPDVEPADQLLKRILAERRAKWEAEELAKMKAKGIKPKDDSWQKKYKEPDGPNTANLQELPEGWAWARAEQLCGFITKGTTPAANKLFDEKGDIPFIKVYNLTHHGHLDFSINPTFVSYETHRNELARSKVLPDDVLMNIVGPPLGKVSSVPDKYPEWNINQAVAIYRPMPSYNKKFLCHCLLTESVLSWATKRSKATAGQFNLTLELCRDLPLPLPPSIEQTKIVEELDRRLSVTEELEVTIGTNFKRAERLRQTILHQAFSGELV